MIEIGISPVAFTIGSISVRWYGIFIALAIVWIVLWLAWQVFRYRRLGDRDPELEQLTVNPRGAPGGIRPAHLEDQLADLDGDPRPAGSFRSTLPTPVEAETPPVPSEDGFRLDHDEGSTPPGPDPGQPDPQEPIGVAKPNRLAGVLAL